jgi:hypothetical protein
MFKCAHLEINPYILHIYYITMGTSTNKKYPLFMLLYVEYIF